MSDQSTNLALPYLQPQQAQKHVTVNEALLRLDAVVQLSAVSATIAAQPASPADGAVYILPAGKTGATWGSMANEALAYWRDGAWEQITPREGWIAWVRDTDRLLVFDGAAWSQSAARAGLGLGSAATRNTGTSGANVPLLDAANSWGALQIAAGGLQAPWARFQAGSYPSFVFQDDAAATDAKRWKLFATPSGEMYLAAEKDDASANNTILLFSRSGATPSAIRLGASPSPLVDNNHSLGTASYRFSTVYAATGAINTSDAREKTPLAPIPDSVKRAVRRVIAQVGVFQWLEAVERKGEDGARLHIGVTAQAVRDAFLAEGEDPARWALFCEDRINSSTANPTGDSRLGVRPDQLLWLTVACLGAGPDA